jgi:hypothetical protein
MPIIEWIVYVVIAVVIGVIVAASMYRWAHWKPSWAFGSGVAVALICGLSNLGAGLPPPGAATISIVLAAALGAFFVVASRRQGRRLRVALIAGAIAFTAAAVLSFPIETHAVKLDMPNPH